MVAWRAPRPSCAACWAMGFEDHNEFRRRVDEGCTELAFVWAQRI